MYDVQDTHKAVRSRIARRIRELRHRHALTQEALAQRSGLSPRHLQKLEAGQINVTIESLVKITNALEVDVSQLFIEPCTEIE
jgi:transcriptional regulator with XRE-family HTH domain